ncbi:MAG: hypothetical protein LBU30_00730 [Candidatus Methanoplasma sp.]|jgi:DNA-binding MarR family transcriptional regulator|nr:hypothetical protein [Candidatus Methanoplasma sp.]
MANLEGRYCHDILLSLMINGRQKKTSLLRDISKSSSMSKRADELEKEGLIRIIPDNFDKNSKWVELTEKGRTVAEFILEINKTLQN